MPQAGKHRHKHRHNKCRNQEVCAQAPQTSTDPGGDPLFRAFSLGITAQQRFDIRRSAPLSAALHGAPQRGRLYRLEQIVDAAGLEGLYGVAVVGGGHDDLGRDFLLAEDLEAVAV